MLWPTTMTGSRLWLAYARRIVPPRRLSHQKATGITEFRFFSDAAHWTRNLAVKIAWPANPIASQRPVSLVNVISGDLPRRAESEPGPDPGSVPPRGRLGPGDDLVAGRP